MNENEADYLNRLFASSSDVTDEAEVTFPLVEVPNELSDKLNSMADSAPMGTNAKSETSLSRGISLSWPKVTGIAASLFVVIMGIQFYQQQQTLKQLEQAQADLATALQYLGEANRIAQTQIIESLNDNINKAGIEPAIEMGFDALRPKPKKADPEPQTRHL